MAFPKLKIADDDGNVADVTSNRLDVNAYLSATPTIDIGDVSLLLGGTAASVNNGASDATTLRVTVASDSTGALTVDLGSNNDVTVTNLIPGTGATNLGKQEDAAHSSGDVGVQMLAVRKGTPADLSNADGDYEPLQLDEGRLWTSTVVTSVPAPTGGTVHSYGRFNAAETATAISDGTNGIAESVTDCKEIIIQPDPANSGFIRVGGLAGVTSGVPVSTLNGIRLEPGDTLVLPASSTDAVLIDGSAASQRVYVMLVR